MVPVVLSLNKKTYLHISDTASSVLLVTSAHFILIRGLFTKYIQWYISCEAFVTLTVNT